MADPAALRLADDGFAQHYSEKLWSWLPEVYRDADFTAPGGEAMRPLIEIIAGEAAVARRAIDRLWENTLIDYADEWAIPYIGELIGARLLVSGNARGLRADVANTIKLRRQAGTLPALYTLVLAITGWPGVVVEGWQRLARHWHGLDDTPFALPFQHAAMARGGFADLRPRARCDALDSAFDSFAHRPDFRRLAGTRGRYAVPKLNVHVFRREAIPIRDSLGLELAPRLFSFDPSGREVALFAGVSLPDSGHFVLPQPWNMPMPIGPALLDHALFAITPATNLAGLGSRLPALVGSTIEGQRQLAEFARLDVGGPPTYPAAATFAALQASTHRADCGKYQLCGTVLRPATGLNFGGLAVLAPEQLAAAAMPPSIPAPLFPPGVRALIDPVRGLVRLDTDNAFRPMAYNYGCFAPVGAGGHEREAAEDPAAIVVNAAPTSLAPIALVPGPLNASVRFPASLSWTLSGQVPVFNRLTWRAASQTRPYVQLFQQFGNTAIFASAVPDPTLPADDPANRREIEIDGLWLTVAQASFPEQVLPAPGAAAAPLMTTIVIDGTNAPIQRVTLRNVTLDPGGERARVLPCRAVAIPCVRLLLRGEVGELVIENSVMGPIEEFAAASDPCSACHMIVRDSIVHALDPAHAAIDLKSGQLTIERSTVFGAIRVNRLYASELLVTGLVTAADNQHGCFRFSAARADPAMRLPRQYESHLLTGGIAPHMFVSQRFGDAGYAQLSQTAPSELQTGAESGSEIGAYSSLLAPIKLADLQTKLDEYAPLNTITGLVLES